jgi:uncharacterized protein GlcG (DUF336 family)
MRRALVAPLVAMVAFTAIPVRAARRHTYTPIVTPAAAQCSEGAMGDGAPQPFAPLSVAEVDAVVQAAASALNASTATVAVVDRAGRVLALYRQSAADPANDDQAAGVARTAAFFSHNQAPLSSRTVRFLSGVHFPPGVVNAPNAALYGIENTNRGCDLGVLFNAGKDVPPAKSLSGGIGPGIVTGKQQPDDGPYPQTIENRPVNAGGIPLYRAGKLVGGVGVVGIAGDPQLDEFAAASGAFAGGLAPVPAYPLPDPGNVFIDGIRLPFLGPDQKLRFDAAGNPVGLVQPKNTAPGTFSASGYVIAPKPGGCADNEWLAGPANAQVQTIVDRAIAASKKTRAIIRLPLNSYARMVIAVADTSGNILGLYRMPDATVFSIDVAVAKARNVVHFSTDTTDLPGIPAGTAVTNRTIGFGAQPLFPPGIDSDVFKVAPGPFYPLFLKDLANPCLQGNGIVFFPGATPLYANGKLIGGLGVSGDGVEQDDYVTYLAAQELLPDPKIWADRIKIGGVRLPMFKFPRQPEGVTECGGKPCS